MCSFRSGVGQQSELFILGKGKCTAIPCDITKMAEIDHLVSFIKKSEPGGLNVLINNAGRMYNEPLESHSSEEFSKDIELNLISLFVVSQRFIPMLAQAASERNPSRIINISSIQGIQTNRGNNFGYSTSKAAVISLTKTLASKLSFQNILVNSIAPGIFPSEMTKPLLENFHDRVVSKVPLKRLGSTHDILGAVVYLSSEASSFVTGVTIPVDGGSLANCKL